MDMQWNLNQLYDDFASAGFERDFRKIDLLSQDLNQYISKNLNSFEQVRDKLEYIILRLIEFQTTYSLLDSYSRLSISVDARNDQALSVIEQLEQKKTLLIKSMAKFQKWLASINEVDSVIASSQLLTEHRFFLEEMIEKSRYLLSDQEEYLIARLSINGAKAWEKLQQRLTATLMVDITVDGQNKKLPLSVIRNMAYEKKATVRQAAYHAELASYKNVEDGVAASLNGIKGEVINITNTRGYKSPLVKTLLDSRLTEETLEIMLQAIKESLPHFHAFYQQKARLLGHQNGLPFYDLFAPTGNSDLRFSYQEAREFIVKNFRTFSNKLADYADNAFAKNWIDAEPRTGKSGGAFCNNIHTIKESRILTNFDGSFNDVTTLAHELGHGYHGYCLEQESILNADYPMPLAETASILCETIVTDAALREAEPEDAFNILETSLSDAGQVIVDIYSRFLFESEVFKLRKTSSLSVDQFKGLMINAQRKAYGDSLDPNYLHPYMWICKPHYYSADLNYYNFPYAFGLLFGKGLYAKYRQEGKDFIKKYDQLLTVTGKREVSAVAQLMGIDLNHLDFWRDSLSLLEADIFRFIEISNSKL